MSSFTYPSFIVPSVGNLEMIQCSPKPLPADYVRCKVLYASINAMDPKLFTNGNFFGLPEPLSLGFDFSGIVIESVSEDFKIGDLVFGCYTYGATFSEQVTVKAGCIYKYSEDDAFDQAGCAYGVAYCSAYEPLLMTEDLKKRAGQWLFVPCGAGGVGHFAVQLGKAYGLKVIASASKPEGLEYLRSLGIEAVIDYSKQDVVAEIMALTNGEGVDICYDSTYLQSSMKQSVGVVKAGGLGFFSA